MGLQLALRIESALHKAAAEGRLIKSALFGPRKNHYDGSGKTACSMGIAILEVGVDEASFSQMITCEVEKRTLIGKPRTKTVGGKVVVNGITDQAVVMGRLFKIPSHRMEEFQKVLGKVIDANDANSAEKAAPILCGALKEMSDESIPDFTVQEARREVKETEARYPEECRKLRRRRAQHGIHWIIGNEHIIPYPMDDLGKKTP